MQLLLIRHAESENNAKPAHARVCDPSITARGRIQAEHLGKWMSEWEIGHLITSPFRRTLQTTESILKHRSDSASRFPIAVWHNVFENGGCYNGHHEGNFSGAPGFGRNQIESFFDALNENIPGETLHPVDIDREIVPEGWWGRDRETLPEMQSRATDVIHRLEQTFPPSPLEADVERPANQVALVAHADFLREMLSQIFVDHVDADEIGPIPNTSITTLQWSAEGWKLTSLNSVKHLPDRLVTGHTSALS
ncbi:histidine phosphatase family protein [Rhodopirellula sp. JC740]|uniref:Histidine phosphatase family protein n=1 Tax=Rhodopirellula halodulae TaxID=2894198 RepID=A0ABS8ND05_9BACT|nr:histidine phosphatase family protein [Rhodopirellula sp. JC740]MCC9641434.1 histidine phosphatase family protein [Rhodopirellula sp. JC740]